MRWASLTFLLENILGCQMFEFVLIINVFAGILAHGDSLSLTNVPGFKTQEECMEAGREANKLATGYKEINFVCVKQTK